jgi:hypothetical protein
MARHWTAEERAKQSAAIRQWQPWENSTGPRTETGKAKTARNAYKGGTRALMRELSVLLKQQKRDLDLIG